MNRLIILLFLGLISLNSFSQFENKGTFIGTNLYFGKEGGENLYFNFTEYYIYISPMVEKLLTENLSLGSYLNINLEYNRTHNFAYNGQEESIEGYWVHDIGITPFFRYYYHIKNSHIYGHAKYGLIFHGNYYTPSVGYSSDTKLHIPTIGIGYLHTFKKLGIFAELNYEWIASKTDGIFKFDDKKLKFEFGVKYYLSKKQN